MSLVSPLSPNMKPTFREKVRAFSSKVKTRFANIGQYSTALMTLKALWNKKKLITKEGPENPFIHNNRKATVKEFFQSIRDQIQTKLGADINKIIGHQTLENALNIFNTTSDSTGIQDLPIDQVKTLVKLTRLQMNKAKGGLPDGAQTVKNHAIAFMGNLLLDKQLDKSYSLAPEDLKKLAVIKRAFPEAVKQFWTDFKQLQEESNPVEQDVQNAIYEPNLFPQEDPKTEAKGFFQSMRDRNLQKLNDKIRTQIDTIKASLREGIVDRNGDLNFEQCTLSEIKTLVHLVKRQIKKAKGTVSDDVQDIQESAVNFANKVYGRPWEFSERKDNLKKLAAIQSLCPEEATDSIQKLKEKQAEYKKDPSAREWDSANCDDILMHDSFI